MLLDLPAPLVEPPPGDEPLVVVVASTTGLEPASVFVETVLGALEAEAVRVIATTSRRGERWRGAVPANATVVDWLDLRTMMQRAGAVVCNGGHGTVAGALSAGAPALVCPVGEYAADGRPCDLGRRRADGPATAVRAATAALGGPPAARRLANRGAGAEPRDLGTGEPRPDAGRRAGGALRAAVGGDDLGEVALGEDLAARQPRGARADPL